MKSRLNVLIALLLPAVSFAQTSAATSKGSYLTNGVFLVLVAVIFLFLLVIIGLAEMLKASATHHARRKKGENNDKAKITGVLLFLLLSSSLFGQTVTDPAKVIVPEIPFDYWGLGAQMFFVLVSIIAGEAIIIYVLMRMSTTLLRTKEPEPIPHDAPLFGFRIFKSITKTQTPEEEEAIMTDHDYDGIKELDNNLPLWWKYGFYFTIVVAVVYLFNYHILGSGLSSKEEYEQEVAQAEVQIAEYKKNSANAVDESTVTLFTDEKSISAGHSIYTQNCAACHGANGEGLVGPNFTDDYWLHGGGIVNVFKSVKYGWPDKGMKAWEQDLKPVDMQQVASYILSLRGTNPANAKAPEGELYMEPGDSLQTSVDSVAIPVDTTKTK